MKKDPSTANLMTRRRLFARVGLAAGAVYVAPTIIGLNAAHASGNSGASGASGGTSGASRSSNSGASRSGTSGVSRGRNSRPSRSGQGNGNNLPLWLRRMLQGN